MSDQTFYVKACCEANLVRLWERACFLFFWRNEKKARLAKKRTAVSLPSAAREGRDGTALRDPLSPPWTLPSHPR
jgi:hypothetical protein